YSFMPAVSYFECLYFISISSTSAVFPYTTLFRSQIVVGLGGAQLGAPLGRLPVLHPRIVEPGHDEQVRVVLRLDVVTGRVGEDRSEEHTSEVQSRENLVCRLLLEKKN